MMPIRSELSAGGGGANVLDSFVAAASTAAPARPTNVRMQQRGRTALPTETEPSPGSLAIRSATGRDQAAIRTLVRSERLNPCGLDWPNFLVAADDTGPKGAVQMRKHPDGSRELSSLVVAVQMRGQGIATRLIDALVADERAPVHLITNVTYAAHYRRWGFRPIEPRQAPRWVRFNYRIGRLACVISFFKRLPPRRLVILERAGAGN